MNSLCGLRRALAGTLFLAAPLAWADRGALSLDVGAGVSALHLSAPYTTSSTRTWGVAPSVSIALRYAWTNAFELSLGGFYDLPVHYTYTDASVQPPPLSEPLRGNLTHELARFGVVAGLRYVMGTIVRPFVGIEGGWTHRAYSDFHHINTLVQPTQDNNLDLPDFGTDNILLQPLLGVEWAFADHASLSVVARVPLLLGPDSTFGVSASIVFSYSWFL